MQDYHYSAFISYRHVSPDQDIAKKLHTLIENYHIPSYLKKSLGVNKMGRVFRDIEELPLSSNLGDDIHNALDSSKWFICICSPRYLESKWCMEELNYFIKLGRRDHVLAILIEGEPKESFPELIRYEKREGKVIEIEPLAADVREESLNKSLNKLNSEKLRILASMLGVNYDDLKQRNKQRRNRIIATIALGVIVLLSSILGYTIYKNNQVTKERNEAQIAESKWLAQSAIEARDSGDNLLSLMLSLEAMPKNIEDPERPITDEAISALYSSLFSNITDEYSSLYEIDIADKPKTRVYSDREKIYIYNQTFTTVYVYDLLTGKELDTTNKTSDVIYTIEDFNEQYQDEELNVSKVVLPILVEGLRDQRLYNNSYLLLNNVNLFSNEEQYNTIYLYCSGLDIPIMHTYKTNEMIGSDYFICHGSNRNVDAVLNFGTSYDGNVIYAQEGRSIFLWDSASEKILKVLSYKDFDNYYFCDSQISHDEPIIVFNTIGGSAFIYNYLNDEIIEIENGVDTIDSIQFNNDSKRVLCLNKSKNCADIYLTTTGEKVSTLTAEFPIETVVYSMIDSNGYVNDDSYVILMGETKLKVYAEGSNISNTVITQVKDTVAHNGDYPVVFSNDGKSLWTVDRRNGYNVTAIDSYTGEIIKEFPTSVLMLNGLKHLKDNYLINFGKNFNNDSLENNYAMAVIYDTSTIAQANIIYPTIKYEEDGKQVEYHYFNIDDILFNKENNLLVFISDKYNNAIIVYDFESGEELWQLNQKEYLQELNKGKIRSINALFKDNELLINFDYEDGNNFGNIIEHRDLKTFELKESNDYKWNEYEKSEYYELFGEKESKEYYFKGHIVSIDETKMVDEEGNVLIDFGKEVVILESSEDGSSIAVTYYENDIYNEKGKILIIHDVNNKTLVDVANSILDGRELTKKQRKKYFLSSY